MPDDSTPPSDARKHQIPQWVPTPRELDDLELLVNGSFFPALDGFVDPSTAGDHPTVTLVVNEETAEETVAARHLDLVDPEGAPLARLTLTATWPAGDGRVGLVGPVEPLAHKAFGPFRSLHLSPAAVHTGHARGDLLAVPVRRPLSTHDLVLIDEAAEQCERAVLLLACTGHDMPQGLSAPALVRATQAAGRLLDRPSVVVALAAADRGGEAANDAFLSSVCQAYAAHTLLLPPEPAPIDELPDQVAAIVVKDRPPRSEQGLVVFFTGLSGSGKSTLARALVDAILERGERTITSLDGDVVRHHLSKGLGFSREDRETNILRIGFVAAEIARHGGMAVCSPIAPFEATRAEVRRMVERAGGGFVLIHVATPLEECERRDRKGLYAKARAGLIPDFTGISSPYEKPKKALKVDTTDRDIVECCEEILGMLTAEGWLTP